MNEIPPAVVKDLIALGGLDERHAAEQEDARQHKRIRAAVCGFCLFLTVSAGEVGAAHYDPLTVVKDFKPSQLDLTVHDAKRDRDIPIRMVGHQRDFGAQRSRFTLEALETLWGDRWQAGQAACSGCEKNETTAIH